MQVHQLLHVLHLLVQRHLQLLEDLRDHPGADDLVPMEGPALARRIALGGGLADVVQERGPAEPDIRLPFLAFRHVVKHLQGMGEVLLVALSLDGFHALELHQLREELLQQAGFVHQAEGHRRLPGDKHLVHLLHDALGGEDLHPVLHRPHRLQRFRDDGERVFGGGELRGEADGAKHAQRVVAVGLFGLERGADDAGREVADAAERIDQAAEILLAQAEGHRVDGEIPPQLVLFQRPVLHDGLPGIAVVGLLARAHELHLDALVVQHRGAEVAEHAHVRMDLRRHGFRERDAAPRT